MSLLTLRKKLRKKRLDIEDASEAGNPLPKRRCPNPVEGPTPCLRSLACSPPAPDRDPRVSQIGPYVLLEPSEGGRCFRAANRQTEAEYTCKVYPSKSYREVMAPYSVLPPHPNIARLAEAIVGEESVYLFFQAGRDDMHNYVRRRKRIPENEGTALFRQMAEAVSHCHRHGIVLRDLKLRKFVFADRERSRLLLENLEDSYVLNGPDDSLEDKHGCPAYVGPEILTSRGSYSGKAADVWSLGVALYTLLAGCYPFQGTKPASLFGKIRRGQFAVPEHLSPKARCLISCLLRKNPAERLTAEEILLHPWLATAGASGGSRNSTGGEQVVPEIGSVQRAEAEEEVEEGLYS